MQKIRCNNSRSKLKQLLPKPSQARTKVVTPLPKRAERRPLSRPRAKDSQPPRKMQISQKEPRLRAKREKERSLLRRSRTSQRIRVSAILSFYDLHLKICLNALRILFRNEADDCTYCRVS